MWTKYFHKVWSQSHNSAHSTQNLHSLQPLNWHTFGWFYKPLSSTLAWIWTRIEAGSFCFIRRIYWKSCVFFNSQLCHRSRNSAENREKAMFVDWRIFLFNIYSTLKAQMCYSLPFKISILAVKQDDKNCWAKIIRYHCGKNIWLHLLSSTQSLVLLLLVIWLPSSNDVISTMEGVRASTMYCFHE